MALGCSGSPANQWTVGPGGGTVVTLATEGQWSSTGAVAVNGTGVYWAGWMSDSSGPYPSTFQLFRAPIDGGAVATISSSHVSSLLGGIAVSGGAAFWTSSPGEPWLGADSITVDATSVYWGAQGHVQKAPLAGGTPTLLAVIGHGQVPGLAVDATSVYWTGGNGAVMMSPLAGGESTTLASQQDQPRGIAVDSTNVYWVTVNGGTVMRLPLEGGAPSTLVSGRSLPTQVAIDAQNLYWDDLGDGNQSVLMKVPLAGGPAVTLVSGPQSALGPNDISSGIAVDDTSVYWTTQHSVLKVTPK